MKDTETVGMGKWGVFGLVAIGVFMSTLDSSIVNIALPVIQDDLKTPISLLEWVVVGYLLTISAFLLTFGRISDILGRGRVYHTGLWGFSTGSLLCAAAPGARWLIAARVVQGIGASMIMACTPALTADAFPARERGRALGMYGAVVAGGLTTGPVLGGLILSVLPWRYIFFINIPVGVAAALMVRRMKDRLSKPAGNSAGFDFAGAGLLAVTVVGFIYGLHFGHLRGWTSPTVLLSLGASLAAAIALVRAEAGAGAPIFHPGLLKVRRFTVPVVSALIMFMALFHVVFLMPFFLVHPMGLEPHGAGLIMVTPFVFLLFITPFSGAASDRIGSRALCSVGLFLLGLSLWLLSGLSPLTTPLDVAWRMALAGVGTAIFISPNTSAALSAVSADQRGVAAGTVATARNMGMVMGVTLAGLIFDMVFRAHNNGIPLSEYRPELVSAFMPAFHTALLSGAVAALFGAGFSWLRGPAKPR